MVGGVDRAVRAAGVEPEAVVRIPGGIGPALDVVGLVQNAGVNPYFDDDCPRFRAR